MKQNQKSMTFRETNINQPDGGCRLIISERYDNTYHVSYLQSHESADKFFGNSEEEHIFYVDPTGQQMATLEFWLNNGYLKIGTLIEELRDDENYTNGETRKITIYRDLDKEETV